MTEDFFLANKDRILDFGEYFLQKLEDHELMDRVAEKDPEKLARVLKLLLDRLDEAAPRAENAALAAIIKAVGGERDDE
ncbi:MAG: hypothetical protein J1F60_07090 [Oscillospiraceae bacterium]|nr:hypothetical protein [Oscillospiraceae bacterium]